MKNKQKVLQILQQIRRAKQKALSPPDNFIPQKK
jgi:hypothetical protein